MSFTTKHFPHFLSLLLLSAQNVVADGQQIPHITVPEARIVDGVDAPVNMHPWFAQATWTYFGQPIGCGGTLVSPEFLLTAAHCPGGNPLAGGWNVGA